MFQLQQTHLQSSVIFFEFHVAQSDRGREDDDHAENGHPQHDLVLADVAQAVHNTGARAGCVVLLILLHYGK